MWYEASSFGTFCCYTESRTLPFVRSELIWSTFMYYTGTCPTTPFVPSKRARASLEGATTWSSAWEAVCSTLPIRATFSQMAKLTISIVLLVRPVLGSPGSAFQLKKARDCLPRGPSFRSSFTAREACRLVCGSQSPSSAQLVSHPLTVLLSYSPLPRPSLEKPAAAPEGISGGRRPYRLPSRMPIPVLLTSLSTAPPPPLAGLVRLSCVKACFPAVMPLGEESTFVNQLHCFCTACMA